MIEELTTEIDKIDHSVRTPRFKARATRHCLRGYYRYRNCKAILNLVYFRFWNKHFKNTGVCVINI